MGHDHPLNYYAVYCPIAIVTHALSRDQNKTKGFRAVGSSSETNPADVAASYKQVSSTRSSKETVRLG